MYSYLIINADDYGYSRAINFGIMDSYKHGVLSSTTMMANMPGFEHGVSLAKENPDLGIGVHLTLTAGKPITQNASTLINADGSFKKLTYYEKEEFTLNQTELYNEWKAQIEKIIEAGITPTHLDSHHHINRLGKISEVFFDLAREYELPVRNNTATPNDIITTSRFSMSLDSMALDKDIWKSMGMNNLINDCHSYKYTEVMCHPGYIDYTLLKNSSFTNNRTRVVDLLISDNLKEKFEENNIKLITFNELRNIKDDKSERQNI